MDRLIHLLQENQRRVPVGEEFWSRFQKALDSTSQQFADMANPMRRKALNALPGYTGYSEPMIRSILEALEMMSLEAFPAAFAISPTYHSASRWQTMDGFPGRIRFYPESNGKKATARIPYLADKAIFQGVEHPQMAIGYGAGNVPGTALLIAMLCLACTMNGEAAPVTIVRNSRQEPIFTPLVLEAIQNADPDLVSSTAVLVWDYEDIRIQELLLSQADLVVAAASDETIGQIRSQVKTYSRRPEARFHAHGHKVSFSVISSEVLQRGLVDPMSGIEMLDIVAFLAALDSVYWDQFGCLSARIHFVEEGKHPGYSARDYTLRLEKQLRTLAGYLPRGAWPRQWIHNRFDRYKQLEGTRKVKVFSGYDDEFVLAFDERELEANQLTSQVNECQGRVIIVRPVMDLKDVPKRYLRHVPQGQLQSLSLAAGKAGDGLDGRLLDFAEACGACGVTAIRTVGRGAFPQLAYSWDGLLPLDLVRLRSAGYFTTIEFEKPYDQMLETYALMLQRGIELDYLST